MGLSRTRFTLGVLALVTVSATSCAASSGAGATSGGPTTSNSTTSTSSTTTTTAPISFANDATVTIAVPHLPANYNPWSPAGSDPVTAMVMEQVWPQVSVLDNRLDTQVCTIISAGCPSALLVSAEPISLNPMTVVYQIAPKATWSDGVPISGEDFAYLRDEVVAEADQLPAIDPVVGYEDIKQLTTSPDGKTVTVVFSKPYADWQSLFTNLVPAHIAAIDGGFITPFSGSNVADLLSGGPYVITHVIPGREVVLARNPHYWGNPARIARLIFRVEPTEAATLKALRDGTVTVGQVPPGQAVTQLINSTTNLVAETTFSPQMWQLDFNLESPIVGVTDTREAIAKAIDRHQLLSDTLGLLTPTSNPVGNRLFSLGIGGGQGNDASYAAVDPAEAEQLLGSAGYHYSANGIALDHGGQPLSITLSGPADDPIEDAVESEIQAELLQVGVEVHIQNQPLRTLLGKTLPSGNWTMALVPYDVTPYLSTTVVLYTNPVGMSTSGVSRLVEPDSVVAGAVSRDVLGLDDLQLPTLYAQAATELNPSSADDLYNQIDIQLWQDLPTLPLYELPVTTVSQNSVQGVAPAETWSTFMYDAQNWSWELNAPPTVTTTTVAPG